MTVKEGTICSVIQAFPVLLILAQNSQRCLKTPLVYKPPTPTHSPEYYEALDALFQSLYGHGYQGSHGNEHGYHGYQEPGPSNCQYSYGHSTKWPASYGGYGGSKPCYQYVYTTGNNYHTHSTGIQGYPSYGTYNTGVHKYPNYGTYSTGVHKYPGYGTYATGVQGYPSYSTYGLKKGNIYSLADNGTMGYAPTQVYNTKNRYQVVVKKTRIGGRRKTGKIERAFFPQRENRNGGFFGQGLLQGPKRIRDRITGLFNPQPVQPMVNTQKPQGNYYVVELPGMTTNQYGNYNGQNIGAPVVFPTNSPVNGIENNGNVNFIPNPDNGNFQPNYGNGENNFNQNQGGTYGFQDNSEESNSVKPNEEDNGVLVDNDAVNFDDVPKVPQETTTLPALTPVPVTNTESRNNFNFQTQGVFMDTCQTVEGSIGSCIPVHQCQPYLRVIQESGTNPDAVQLLRRSHCGFEGTAPKVCCPRPGIPDTPISVTTTTSTPAPTRAPTPAPTAAPSPAPTKPQQTAAPATTSVGDFLPALLEPPVCGMSNASFSRVVGGVDAKLGDFPWMALLGYKSKRTGGTSWLCGGSLVSSRHVLTAAHCIHNHEDDLYVVRLGELDLAREDDGAAPVDLLIKQKIKHEQYSPTAFTNDIGILILDHDATFSDLIRPICIPKDSELRARSFENYNPMIAGWGHTEFRGPAATHLQVLQLPVVSNEYCGQAYSAYKAQQIDERVLCAGFRQGGKDACQGDSGGPLMQPIYNQKTYQTFFYQIGVVSYGKKCAEANFPGVYSRVTHFVPWIEEKLLGRST